jgi:hypothetical protein
MISLTRVKRADNVTKDSTSAATINNFLLGPAGFCQALYAMFIVARIP